MGWLVSQIPAETFKQLQRGAGMILKKFDISMAQAFDPTDIVCATSGGVTFAVKPTTKDHAEDIDNAKEGMIELTEVTSYEVTAGFDCVSVTEDTLKMSLGLTTGTASAGLKPVHGMLTKANGTDLWWASPMSDGTKILALNIKNAFSVDGFSLKTEDDGNGKVSMSLKGMYSIEAQDEVPFACYLLTKSED